MNNINICFTSDNNYAPYLAVAIASLLLNSSKENNYSIYILEKNISFSNKRKLKMLSENHNNSEIFFIDIQNHVEKKLLDSLHTCDHFTDAIYYRIFAADIFKQMEKIIYLDSDIVVLDDISKLYNEELDENLVAAVVDTGLLTMLHYEKKKDKNYWANYITKTLGIVNPARYFQSAVLVMNLNLMRKEELLEKCLNQLQILKTPRWPDQDLLNIVCQGKIKYLSVDWDIQWTHIIGENSNLEDPELSEIKNKYFDALSNPKIIHYCGQEKPWSSPQLCLAEYFWKYARTTSFYEQIIYDNNNNKNNNNDIYRVVNIGRIKRKYYFYRIMSYVSFGKINKKYKEKYKKIKAEVKRLRQYEKRMRLY